MRLVEKGDIYKKTYAGYYCDREERFVTEEELDENKCLKENGAPTRWTEDENYFFKLSRYSDEIKKKLESGEVKITPEFRQNEMIAMIGDGLEDVSFSRTKKQLTWGIPVPNDPEHVMYVWCDALTNYISGSLHRKYRRRFQKLELWTPCHRQGYSTIPLSHMDWYAPLCWNQSTKKHPRPRFRKW
jgi:methionyl-tRNA synthetase